MTASAVRLVGDEWEAWANRLLSQHFGPTDYQRVPDKDRGDAGIEGFSMSMREAFQSYGCEEPVSVEERYKKQRNKMTKDIRKFIVNKDVLVGLFGPTLKIRRWVLLVPVFDSKEIVAHAATKTQEVIDAGLPYVADDFRVMVVDESNFVVARDQLLCATTQSLKISTLPVTAAEVTAWSQSNSNLLDVLREKVSKLPTLQTEKKRDDFIERILKWYIAGQTLLGRLRDYPQVYEKVVETKSHRENFLALNSLKGSASNVVVNDTLEDFKATLLREAKELHSFCADQLAAEAVADWLMRCPLQFPDAEHD